MVKLQLMLKHLEMNFLEGLGKFIVQDHSICPSQLSPP